MMGLLINLYIFWRFEHVKIHIVIHKIYMMFFRINIIESRKSVDIYIYMRKYISI